VMQQMAGDLKVLINKQRFLQVSAEERVSCHTLLQPCGLSCMEAAWCLFTSHPAASSRRQGCRSVARTSQRGAA
jgi:hypothetical protein